MNPVSWGFIGAIIGTIVGSGTSILTTYLNNKKSIQLQENSEKFKKQERFQEFQAKNLLELQEELAKGMRIVGRIHIHDVENFRKNGQWMLEKLDHKLDNELVESLRLLSILTERIADNDLRDGIIQLRIKITDCLFAKSLSERDEYMNQLSQEFNTIMPKIGKVLRLYY